MEGTKTIFVMDLCCYSSPNISNLFIINMIRNVLGYRSYYSETENCGIERRH